MFWAQQPVSKPDSGSWAVKRGWIKNSGWPVSWSVLIRFSVPLKFSNVWIWRDFSRSKSVCPITFLCPQINRIIYPRLLQIFCIIHISIFFFVFSNQIHLSSSRFFFLENACCRLIGSRNTNRKQWAGFWCQQCICYLFEDKLLWANRLSLPSGIYVSDWDNRGRSRPALSEKGEAP